MFKPLISDRCLHESPVPQPFAGRSYSAVVRPDMLTDGTPWFVAEHPDLPGCISDGATESEALRNLDDARREYIQSLIDDDAGE